MRPNRRLCRCCAYGGLVVLFGALGVWRSETAPAAPAQQVPASIDATGHDDVTDALNAFLAQAAPGSTIEFPANARYRAEGIVQLDGVNGLTLDGNGAQLFADTDGSGRPPPTKGAKAHWPRLRTQLFIRNASNITVDNLQIRGPNGSGKYEATLEGQAGVEIVNSIHVTLDHLHVESTFGDAVYIGGTSSAVIVRNSVATNVGRQGVALVGGSDVQIVDNEFSGVARSVVDIEPPPNRPVSKVHVERNRIGSYHNFALAVGGGGPNVTDIWLQDNDIEGGNGLTVYAVTRGPVRSNLNIVDNTSHVSGHEVTATGRRGLIQLANLDSVTIRGNTQELSDSMVAITTQNVCGLSMSDNDFSGGDPPVKVVTKCGTGARPAAGAASPNTTSRTGPKASSKAAAAVRTPSTTNAKPAESSHLGWVAAIGAIALLVLLVVVTRRRTRTAG